MFVEPKMPAQEKKKKKKKEQQIFNGKQKKPKVEPKIKSKVRCGYINVFFWFLNS